MNTVIQYVQQPPVSISSDALFSVISPDVSTVNENRNEEALLEKGYV